MPTTCRPTIALTHTARLDTATLTCTCGTYTETRRGADNAARAVAATHTAR